MFWKRLLIVILIVVTLCLLVAAFVYIPRYLDEEQRVRDSSTSCKQYREFLQTAENWNKIGDTVQANGVYSIAVDLLWFIILLDHSFQRRLPAAILIPLLSSSTGKTGY